jgi:hypothetical protein
MRDFLSGFSRLAHLALQNVNKDCVIFLYFRNSVAKSDQKPKIDEDSNFAKNQNINPVSFAELEAVSFRFDFMLFSSNFGNLGFGCFWQRSYENIT